MLIIQTWWHDDDLSGKIQRMMKEGSDDQYVDQFEVVKYPAIAEHDEYLDETTREIVRLDESEKVPADRPLVALRKKGEPLHAERYDLDKLLRIKAQNKGGRWWSALYQQNPVPDDGAYFTKDQFRRGIVPGIARTNVFIAWDFAISEKKQNDYTVGSVGLQDDDDVLHVADMVRFKSGDSLFIVESILKLCKKWYSPTLTLGFEDGQIWRAIEALLKKRMRRPNTIRRLLCSSQLLIKWRGREHCRGVCSRGWSVSTLTEVGLTRLEQRCCASPQAFTTIRLILFHGWRRW